MKRVIAGLLAMIIMISGIEPIALMAAEKDEKAAQVEESGSVLPEQSMTDKVPVEVPDGDFFEVVDEVSAGSMSRASTIASGTCGANANWTLDSDYTLAITGSGAMYDYTNYKEQPWYQYAEDIKTIKIANGITRIGNSAFQCFYNVTGVQWPSSMTEVGEWAFNMTFPYVESTLIIPANITTIGYGAFASNKYLQGFNVDSSNSNYCSVDGHLLTKDKARLVQAGRLTDTQINLPSTVESIYPGALNWGDYTSLENKNIKYVSYNSLQACRNLENVKLDNVVWIGDGAFYDCTKLSSFTFPESFEKIYGHVFEKCTALKTLTFKGNAPSFEDDTAFRGITATVYYDSSKSGWTSSVRQNYGGTITWKDVNQGSKQNNTITASSVTKTVSSSSQSFSLGASAKDNASLSYSSDNSSISVNSSGRCTISANYIGQATITIKAAATSNYKETTKTITVTVLPVKAQITSLTSSGTTVTMKVNNDIGNVEYDIRYSTSSDMSSSKYSYCNDYSSSGIKVSGLTSGKTYYFQVRGTKSVGGTWYDGAWSASKKITVGKKTQTITAKNISKTVSSSERKVAINASTNGNGKLTYKSSNSKIKIKSGKVVIPKNFIGKATITITAASTSKYSKATKKITVTVKPVKATINSVKNNKKGLITIKIKKNIGSVKYQIQVAKDSGFENKISKNKSYNSDGYTVSGLEKGKTYYVRVRGYKKVNDVTYYGKWSDVKKIKISK